MLGRRISVIISSDDSLSTEWFSESGTRMLTGNSLRQFALERYFLPTSCLQTYSSCLSPYKGNLYWEFPQTPTSSANGVPHSCLQWSILTNFHNSFSPQPLPYPWELLSLSGMVALSKCLTPRGNELVGSLSPCHFHLLVSLRTPEKGVLPSGSFLFGIYENKFRIELGVSYRKHTTKAGREHGAHDSLWCSCSSHLISQTWFLREDTAG